MCNRPISSRGDISRFVSAVATIARGNAVARNCNAVQSPALLTLLCRVAFTHKQPSHILTLCNVLRTSKEESRIDPFPCDDVLARWNDTIKVSISSRLNGATVNYSKQHEAIKRQRTRPSREIARSSNNVLIYYLTLSIWSNNYPMRDSPGIRKGERTWNDKSL